MKIELGENRERVLRSFVTHADVIAFIKSKPGGYQFCPEGMSMPIGSVIMLIKDIIEEKYGPVLEAITAADVSRNKCSVDKGSLDTETVRLLILGNNG